MKLSKSLSFAVLLTLLGCAVLAPAQAAPASPSRTAIKSNFIQPVTEQLGQKIQTLLNGAPPTGAEDAPDEQTTENTPTFGSRSLTFVLEVADIVRAQSQVFVTNFAALPQLSGWFNQQTNDPHLRSRWIAMAQDMRDIVGVPLLGALLFEFVLAFPRASLKRRRPHRFSGKAGTILTLFLLRGLPILLFIGLSITFLGQNEPQKLSRFIIFSVISAIAIARITTTLFRGLLAPNISALRLFPIDTDQAVYAYRWLSVYSVLIIFGYFLGDIARAVRVPDAVVIAFATILGFVLVLMTIVVITQKRAFVAALIRGQLSAAQKDLTAIASLRLWLARSWHILAIMYLLIGYAIAALGVANGLALMLRGTILTLTILVSVRVLFGAADRWAARRGGSGVSMHHAVVRALVHIVVWMSAVIAIAAAWGADIPTLSTTPLGQRLLGSAFSIGVTIIVMSLIYEVFSFSVDRHINRSSDDGKGLQASARMRTLLPMIRHSLFILLTLIVGMVVLSEAGLNIGPLLAGAGVLGVAVGFGSQTLVKDFLTGLFIVIENTIAIGDIVEVGKHAGVVETLSIRTVRLRDENGALHILPFSEVTQIVNMSKDFGYAVINVGVAYSTDIEHAMNVIRSVGDELMKDPVYKRVILEPVEMWGVDQLADSCVKLVARMRTRPGKQWEVKRIFLLRLKQRFEAEKIEIPFPTMIHIHK